MTKAGAARVPESAFDQRRLEASPHTFKIRAETPGEKRMKARVVVLGGHLRRHRTPALLTVERTDIEGFLGALSGALTGT